MANKNTNWIDFYISLTEVAQVGIWAALAGVLLVRFRKPILNVVESVTDRVERGDNVDLFGLKLERIQASAKLEASIEAEVRSALDEILADSQNGNGAEVVSDKVISGIRKRAFLTLDFSPVGKDEKQSIPYSQFESIGLLLRYVWMETRKFKVHSYNKEWVLKNDRTDEYLTEVGSRFARSNLGTRWDERHLSKVGIMVGDTISVHWK